MPVTLAPRVLNSGCALAGDACSDAAGTAPEPASLSEPATLGSPGRRPESLSLGVTVTVAEHLLPRVSATAGEPVHCQSLIASESASQAAPQAACRNLPVNLTRNAAASHGYCDWQYSDCQ